MKRGTDNPDAFYWSETRRLTWDDFQGTPILGETVGSEILVKNPASIQRKNLLAKTQIFVECYFDKKSSWVNRKHATDDLLAYNQTIFDIYELYSRKLREAFDTTSFGAQDAIEVFNELVEKNSQEMNKRIQEFRIESNMGRDAEKAKLWSEAILSEIRSLDKYK
jgi:hypothetical protein